MHIAFVNPHYNAASSTQTSMDHTTDGADEQLVCTPAHSDEDADTQGINVMLLLLDTLTEGLTPRLRQQLLRKASRLPGPYGKFKWMQGEVVFHSCDGEVIGTGGPTFHTAHNERKRLR